MELQSDPRVHLGNLKNGFLKPPDLAKKMKARTGKFWREDQLRAVCD